MGTGVVPIGVVDGGQVSMGVLMVLYLLSMHWMRRRCAMAWRTVVGGFVQGIRIPNVGKSKTHVPGIGATGKRSQTISSSTTPMHWLEHWALMQTCTFTESTGYSIIRNETRSEVFSFGRTVDRVCDRLPDCGDC